MNGDSNHYFPVYFRDWRAIRQAVDGPEGWKLFNACLDYAESGITPDFYGDKKLTAFFSLLSFGIDKGKEKADSVKHKRRYASYCARCKERGIASLSFAEWVSSEIK